MRSRERKGKNSHLMKRDTSVLSRASTNIHWISAQNLIQTHPRKFSVCLKKGSGARNYFGFVEGKILFSKRVYYTQFFSKNRQPNNCMKTEGKNSVNVLIEFHRKICSTCNHKFENKENQHWVYFGTCK